MSVHGPDVWRLLTLAEADFRSGFAKLTELRAYLAALGVPDAAPRPECPICGVGLDGPRKVAEHVYRLHDGPEPEHWVEVERLAET